MRKPTRPGIWGRLSWRAKRAINATCHSAGILTAARVYRESSATREVLCGGWWNTQLETREGRTRPSGMADGPVRPVKPGNAGEGKGPEFKVNARRGEGRQEIGS